MSTQDPLFHEDFNDALLSAVKALGKVEAVARELWPNKANAGRYLSDCLNPDRDAKLSLEDVVALLRMARDKGIHWAMHQLCDAVGYQRPDITTPKSRHQEVAEGMQKAVADFKRFADEAAALNRVTDAQLRAIR